MNLKAKKDDYILSDLKRQSSPKIAIGITYNLNDDAVRQQGQLGSYVIDDSTGEYINNTLNHFEADMIFKYQGISALVEWAKTSGESGIAGFRTGDGFNAQIGYLFENNFEIAGRYTTISPDETISRINDETHYTLGVSKYIVDHKLKIQSDFSMVDLANSDDLNYLYRLQFEMQL